MAEFSPGCWFEDCGGGTDMYDDFVEGKGVDEDSQAYDAGDDTAEVAAWLSGVGGIFKSIAKKLVKNSGKKTAKDAEAPKSKCKCFLAGSRSASLKASGESVNAAW